VQHGSALGSGQAGGDVHDPGAQRRAAGDGMVLPGEGAGRAQQVVGDAGLLPASPLIPAGARVDLPGTVRLNPDHGAWINRLLATAGVQPVWASTWERAASVIEPTLGLSVPLPVVEFSQRHDVPAWNRTRIDARSVKIDVLNALYPDQPLVWIDDLITQSRVGRLRGTHGGPRRRYQHVDPFTGLTASDIAQVDAFIAWAAQQPQGRDLPYRIGRAAVQSRGTGPDQGIDQRDGPSVISDATNHRR